jgi:hypothetical protein
MPKTKLFIVTDSKKNKVFVRTTNPALALRKALETKIMYYPLKVDLFTDNIVY